MLTEKELVKNIKRVITAYNAKAIKEDTHQLLCDLVEFCNFHRDGTHLDMLFNGLPNTANKRGMRLWLQKYTFWDLRQNKQGKKIFMSRHPETGKTEYTFIVEGRSLEYAFYNLSEVALDAEKPIKPFDLLSMLNALLDKGEKAVEEKRLTDPVQLRILSVLNADLPKLVKACTEAQFNEERKSNPTDNSSEGAATKSLAIAA